DALKKVQTLGLKRLKQGRSVLIFPEGTRVKVGEKGRYARSGATLAIASESLILPIAHNAGLNWQNKQKKRAGTITFIIGEPISTANKTAKQLTDEVEVWIEQQCNTLLTTKT
ncbi:MAG: lysophospholipid acyltransferase family protein, partial [Pseudomonadales bacterium]